jgi:hypothetical protein
VTGHFRQPVLSDSPFFRTGTLFRNGSGFTATRRARRLGLTVGSTGDDAGTRRRSLQRVTRQIDSSVTVSIDVKTAALAVIHAFGQVQFGFHRTTAGTHFLSWGTICRL